MMERHLNERTSAAFPEARARADAADPEMDPVDHMVLGPIALASVVLSVYIDVCVYIYIYIYYT